MLYAIYVAELEVNSQEIQYADDVCIFFCYGLEESLNKIESAADKIFASLNNLDLTLSAEKTKLCVFSKNNKALKTQVRW